MHLARDGFPVKIEGQLFFLSFLIFDVHFLPLVLSVQLDGNLSTLTKQEALHVMGGQYKGGVSVTMLYNRSYMYIRT